MYKYLLLISLSVPFWGVEAADFSSLPKEEQIHIADLIYRNECNRKADCLVSWNDGEQFASLGIGHFIWFPKGSNAPFQESFPDLLMWFDKSGVKTPEILSPWLTAEKPSPWNSKQEFLKPENQNGIKLLRDFLTQTKSEQAAFIMNRLSKALPKILEAGSSKVGKQYIRKQFHRVSSSASGWYILADYVNFKGEGIKHSERYRGKGWGLAQVLLNMKGETIGEQARLSFVESATYVLERRVRLSPTARNEQVWLAGWKKRLSTYLVD